MSPDDQEREAVRAEIAETGDFGDRTDPEEDPDLREPVETGDFGEIADAETTGIFEEPEILPDLAHTVRVDPDSSWSELSTPISECSDRTEISKAFLQPLLGRRLAGCVLDSVLGHGAMGIVFRSKHLALEKTVAVKVLNPALFYKRRHVDQFFREARAAAALEHPNVVTVHDVGKSRGLYYIVMKLVEGESVADRIQRLGSLPVAETIRIGIETARGLSVAHERGIIHRDVKPANLLLDSEDRVLVADFGLAGPCVAPEEAEGRTEVMGTPYYIPPEQITGGAVDARGDLYSLGVTLYLAASGVRPFEGETPKDIFVQHLTARARPLSEIGFAGVPRFCAVVHSLLSKKPADRPADAGELIRRLEEAAEEVPAT